VGIRDKDEESTSEKRMLGGLERECKRTEAETKTNAKVSEAVKCKQEEKTRGCE
jgi:hypothetical protein